MKIDTFCEKIMGAKLHPWQREMLVHMEAHFERHRRRGYYGEYKMPVDWTHFHNWKTAVTTSPSKLLHYWARQRPRLPLPTVRASSSLRSHLQMIGRGIRIIPVTAPRDHLPADVSTRRFTEFKP